MMFDKCEKCIIGAYDASRAPCQNCYDRYSKTEIQKAALEFVKEKHKLSKEDTKDMANELRTKGEQNA